MKTRKTDAELDRQMRAAKGNGTVEAVLRVQEPPARASASGRLETWVRRLVRGVERETGLKATELHVFQNLGAFVVCGPPALVQALLEVDEVVMGVANRRPAPVPVPVPAPTPHRRPVTKRGPKTRRTRT